MIKLLYQYLVIIKAIKCLTKTKSLQENFFFLFLIGGIGLKDQRIFIGK